MATVKVVYNYEARRFFIPSTSTWSELESQLRTLFKIPDTLRVITSYLDEENDNITLSSDLELQEVVSQYSTGIPIKLVLSTFPIDVEEAATAIEHLKINDDGARVHFAHLESENTETETERDTKDCEEKYNEFEYVSTEEEADQSSSDPEIYFIVKNSHDSKREPRFGYAKFDSPEGSSGCPFMRDELRSSHKGPSYRFHGAHGRPYPIPKPVERTPGPYGNFGHFSPFCRGGFRGHGFGPFGPGGFHGHGFGPRDKHAKESDPHDHGHKFGKRGYGHKHGHGHPGHGHPGHGHPGNGHPDYGHRGHGHRGHGRRGHCHGPLTPEELAEKVELLNSMGFPPENNAHYEELLKKFGGRIGHVVEILLCERKRKDDEDKKPGDDGKDHEEGEASATMEI